MTRSSSLSIVLLMCLAAAPALADDSAVDQARAAIDGVDYPAALRLLDQALASGTLSPPDVATAWRLKGIVEASLGNADGATEAFVELLSLDPDATLDGGLPPRVVEAFQAGKAAARPITLSCRLDSDQRLLVVELDPGASKRARYVRVEGLAEGEQPVRNRVSPPVSLALPDGPARFACFAVDEAGNEWLAGPERSSPLVWAPPASEPAVGSVMESPSGAPERDSAGWWRSPWLWGGAAGATLATGAVFGLLARSDQNEYDDLADTRSEVEFTRAEDVLDRGRTRATVANALFVTGGALAIATAVVWWTEPDDERAGVSTIGVGPSGFTIAGCF